VLTTTCNFDGTDKKTKKKEETKIQGVIESCTDILTTSYWLHVQLRKNKNDIYFLSYNFF
jgi:hypothetical protein